MSNTHLPCNHSKLFVNDFRGATPIEPCMWCEVSRLRNDLTALTLERDELKRMNAATPDLVEIAKRYASECKHCNYGDGATGLGSEGEPCEECGDIHAAIDKAEGL